MPRTGIVSNAITPAAAPMMGIDEAVFFVRMYCIHIAALMYAARMLKNRRTAPMVQRSQNTRISILIYGA
jgi:hypothetical protein